MTDNQQATDDFTQKWSEQHHFIHQAKQEALEDIQRLDEAIERGNAILQGEEE